MDNASSSSNSTAGTQRKRRPHKKSRRGCGNCKLRRVKCDETKPSCNVCAQFGVSCNYGPLSTTSTGELMLSFRGVTHIEPVRRPPVSMRKSMMGMINRSLTTHSNQSSTWMPIYQVKTQDVEILDRFWSRTILTLGADSTRSLYQKESYRLGTMHSFLVHLAINVTLQHDRAISSDPCAPPSAAELFHAAQGASLFNSRLSNPESCSGSELDALWVGAAILGVSAMAAVEARTPEEAWPLKPRPASEPHWLSIGDGKKEVWRITDLGRPDSSLQKLVKPVIDVFLTEPPPPTRDELCNFPPEIIQFLGLSDSSAKRDNPRFKPAMIMSRLMPLEYSSATILQFIAFLTQIGPEFHHLLEQKDPGALLLLAYWYTKVSKYRQWFTWRRSILECQAICIYLRRYHGDLPNLEIALQYPESVCGGFGGLILRDRQLQISERPTQLLTS